MNEEERMENEIGYGDVSHDETYAEGDSQEQLGGTVHVAEDVIAQIASRALSSVDGVVPSTASLMSNLRMGRKAVNGVRITMSENEEQSVSVDTYVSVRYGLRIPDVCWDVQAAIKDQIERFSGKTVKSVNVYVQGMIFEEDASGDRAGETAAETDHASEGGDGSY